MTQDTTPTSGAADLLDLIEAYAEARHRQGHSSYNAQTAVALQAVKDALAAWQATAAQAQPAAQQGAAYAALPEPLEIDWPELHSQALGCGVEDRGLHNRYECAEYGWQDGVDKCAERVPEQLFDADQMHAFADATYALRAAHGQAPAPTHEQIAAYLESTGAYVTNDATREAAIAEAIDTDRAKRGQAPATAHADSVTEPAGVEEGDIDAVALARYKVVPAHESMIHRFAVVAGDGNQQLYLGREVECENMARKFAGAFLDGAFYQSQIAAAPTPAAQAADSVQEDAARLDFLIDQRAYVVSDPDACPGHWLHWSMPDGSTWVQGDEHPTPRAAIDAARKQGATK